MVEKEQSLGVSRQKRLRVCMVIPKLRFGGAEVQILSLLKHLDTSVLALSLCCLTGGNPEIEKEAERYVDCIYRLGFRWRYLPGSFLRLVKYLQQGRFDVVHCHLGPADSIGRLAGWVARVPILVTTEHGRNLGKGWAHLILERALNRITDLRICVSRDIMEIRLRRERTPAEKLEYIPNAVDPMIFRRQGRRRAETMGEFGWHPHDPLVLSVGRLAPEKNHLLLVEVIAIVRDHIPNVRCVLAGDGDCREMIAGRIKALRAEQNIKLTGTRRDIPDLLQAADVFILTSLKEGLPVSLIEAMAAGKAIVATSVGGIPDAITDGENGMLVPSEDTDALASAVERLLEDGAFRRRLGRAASMVVEQRFSLRKTAERTKQIYVELYEKKKGEMPA